MKKLNLLLLLLAMGVIACAVPAANVQAVSHSASLSAQEDESAERMAQETETQTFTGQIMNHDGKYVLFGEDEKTYQLHDQGKTKDFDGEGVKVTASGRGEHDHLPERN